ncbi:MAG TPA: aminotransferase class III-fold pyridoxal phosphate-dependent enzyme, partial [Bacillota bacterium]|nr:aminotransferase class III-fold pyridoxal phosphate-dependent enzyme [Bacillota bacterium]
EIGSKYPFFKEVRGLGLLIGMELTIPGREIVSRCMEQGLIINCTANTVLRFVPPINITTRHVDAALETLDCVLNKIEY